METSKFRLGYIPALDGIRGMAIILVMMAHANVPFAQGGFIGVDIFFVLSGFLITALLLKEFDEHATIHFKRFYMRRILRLLPALIVMLIVLNLLSVILLNTVERQNNLIDSFIALFYLSNWTFALGFRPLFFLTHTWSLSSEEQFYILWPIILFLLLRMQSSKEKIFGIVLALATASWLWRVILTITVMSYPRVFFSLDTRMDGLLMGCALAILIAINPHQLMKWAHRTPFIPVATVVIIGLMGLITDGNSTSTPFWSIASVGLLTTITVFYFVINPTSWLKSFFELKPLVFVGRISYGLYLWHYIIFKYMTDYLHMSWAGTLIIGGGLALLISLLSYYFIEQPILSLKSKFSVPTRRIIHEPDSLVTPSTSG
ncbi:MAG: acyltransferase [Anaerolineae bacterium]|nr:acyltransferase [Anaerolineae bacterium]